LAFKITAQSTFSHATIKAKIKKITKLFQDLSRQHRLNVQMTLTTKECMLLYVKYKTLL